MELGTSPPQLRPSYPGLLHSAEEHGALLSVIVPILLRTLLFSSLLSMPTASGRWPEFRLPSVKERENLLKRPRESISTQPEKSRPAAGPGSAQALREE